MPAAQTSRTKSSNEEDPTLKNRIRILSITAKEYGDLGDWFKSLNENSKTKTARG